MFQNKRMVAEFDASTSRFNQKVHAMGDNVGKFQRESVAGFAKTDRATESTIAALNRLRSTAVALGAAATVVGFVRLADSAKQVDNQLRGIGAASKETKEQIFALAIETRTPIEATVGLLRSMQKSLKDQSLETTIRQVGTLNRLLAIGGLDGAARGSVSLQFGQALQSGVLAGDELRSLREAAPFELLEAIAKAAGGTTEQLKDLGSQGKLTRTVMVQALTDLEATSKAKFGDFNVTVGEAASTLRTAMIAVSGEVDGGLGLASGISETLGAIADFLIRNKDAAEEFGKAMKVLAGVALTLVGARGLAALAAALRTTVTRLVALRAATTATAASMAVLRGSMAFIGGPIGLAVVALSLGFAAVAANASSLSDRMGDAKRAIDEYEASIDAVTAINGDLAAAQEQMISASERYKAAVESEGPAAQATAATEIAAINQRIDALNKLREARLGEAQVAALEASAALSDLTTGVRRNVRSQIAGERLEEYRANGKSIRYDGVPKISDAEIDAGVQDQITEIGIRVGQGDETLTTDNLDLFKAANLEKRFKAKVELLEVELEKAIAGAVSEIDAGGGGGGSSTGSNLEAFVKDADLTSRKVTALRKTITDIRDEVAKGGLSDALKSEAEEAIAKYEAEIGRLSGDKTTSKGSTKTDKTLQEAETIAAALIQQTATAEEQRAAQIDEIASARARLVAVYGEESDVVGQLDEATARLGSTGNDSLSNLSNSLLGLIGQGAEFEDVLKMIVVQMLQMNGLSAFKSLFSGGGLGEFSGSLVGSKFANGGIMTPSGAKPLRRYSKGGIANTSQFAEFGEGDTPEAYVPLPDGRSIPVTLDLPDLSRLSGVQGSGESGAAMTFVSNISIQAQSGDPEAIAAAVRTVAREEAQKNFARAKREGLL